MNKICKRQSRAFNKDLYLVGETKDGEFVWLESPSWDCNWYWGFGYMETFTNNLHPERARGISSHQHFEGFVGFKNEKGDYVHHINESPMLKSTVLSDKESWELSDLMKQFYTLKDTAAIYHTGNAHLTSGGIDNKNPAGEKEINEVIMPKIFARIIEILTPPDPAKSAEAFV